LDIPKIFGLTRILAQTSRLRYEIMPACRKHMMCPVAVANEMSGLKGRVG